MAQKTVCDVCWADIAKTDSDTVEYHGVSLHLTAERWEPGAWKEADLCAACLHGAAEAHDKSPQPAPQPYGPFRWLVTIVGVRTPGPHAGFVFEEDARRFMAICGDGVTVRPA